MNHRLHHDEFRELTSILPRLSFPQLLEFGLSFHCFPPPQPSLRKLSFKALVTVGEGRGTRKCARRGLKGQAPSKGEAQARGLLTQRSSCVDSAACLWVPTILQIQTLAAQPGTPSAFSGGADDAGARRRPANCCSPIQGRRTRAPEPGSPGLEGAGWPGWRPRSLPLQPRTAPAYQRPISRSLRPDQNSCERLRLARSPSLDAHSDSLARLPAWAARIV